MLSATDLSAQTVINQLVHNIWEAQGNLLKAKVSQAQQANKHCHAVSDVRAWDWPEAHGLGLAFKGLGLFISLARPLIKAWAWSGLVWAQAQAYYQF